MDDINAMYVAATQIEKETIASKERWAEYTVNIDVGLAPKPDCKTILTLLERVSIKFWDSYQLLLLVVLFLESHKRHQPTYKFPLRLLWEETKALQIFYMTLVYVVHMMRQLYSNTQQM